MSRKLFIITALMAVILAACSGQASVETATPAPTETQAATPSPEASPTVPDTETATAPATPPTETSTPETPRPTNPPDCTNHATFVADVTIPDNTEIPAGAMFTKTWRVGNLGTCTWGPDYTLTYYSDERMSAPPSVPLDITGPGEFIEISVDLRAPNAVGTYRGNFVIKNPAGLIMAVDDDSRLWVIIDVIDTITLTPTLTSTGISVTPSGSPTP